MRARAIIEICFRNVQRLSSHSDSLQSEHESSENSFDASVTRRLARVEEHRPGYVAHPVGRDLSFRMTKVQMEAKKATKRIFLDLESCPKNE